MLRAQLIRSTRMSASLFICVLLPWGCQGRLDGTAGPAVSSSASEAKAEAPEVWRPCRLPGLSEPATCARIPVFEDRAAKSGRKLHIHVARLTASRGTSLADPLVFLAGGPGQAASHVAAHVLPGLRRVRRKRDILFVDLRGTGRSNPLACAPKNDANADLAEVFELEVKEKVLTNCRASYQANLQHYTTANAVDDLEDVRRALGLGPVNALGVSYGSRVVLTWMRRHPAAVRAAILDGVAPPQMPLFAPFARDAQRAWRLLVRDCAANTICHARFPKLAGGLERLLARLPQTVHLTHPVTSLPATVTLTKAGVAMAFRGLLYSAELAALIPLTIEQAAAGDWQPLVAQALLLSDAAGTTTSLGLMLSTVCAEDLPRVTAMEIAAEVSGTFLGTAAIDTAIGMCDRWPLQHGQSAAAAATHLRSSATLKRAQKLSVAVTSDVPTLLLSGEADPVTPPRWAELARASLRHAAHVVLTGLGHSVSGRGCAPKVIAAFLTAADDPAAAVAGARCEMQTHRPAFFLSPSGPSP